MTLIELKAQAYDLLAAIENTQAQAKAIIEDHTAKLQEVNKQIAEIYELAEKQTTPELQEVP